jgi:hypothetical protein
MVARMSHRSRSDALARWMAELRRPMSAPPALTTWACPVCSSSAIGHVEWEPRPAGYRAALVRCGECHAWRQTTMTVPVARRFEQHLARSLAALEEDLQRLRAWVVSDTDPWARPA